METGAASFWLKKYLLLSQGCIFPALLHNSKSSQCSEVIKHLFKKLKKKIIHLHFAVL